MVADKREQMIVDNLGLVHSIAHKFIGRGIEYDDLYQSGCYGLIKAVDNFDEEKGFQFSTYAVPVIMGEIKRQFRDGGAIKVSRSLKEKSIYVQAVREKYRTKNLCEPTVSELAQMCAISVEELAEILNILTPVASLSYAYEDDDSSIDVPVDDTDQLFDRLSINQAMHNLSKDEIRLVNLRFFEGKTQTQTANLMGISQVQVSRKEKRILLKLREKLA